MVQKATFPRCWACGRKLMVRFVLPLCVECRGVQEYLRWAKRRVAERALSQATGERWRGPGDPPPVQLKLFPGPDGPDSPVHGRD
jgi:hypothetical protein